MISTPGIERMMHSNTCYSKRCIHLRAWVCSRVCDARARGLKSFGFGPPCFEYGLRTLLLLLQSESRDLCTNGQTDDTCAISGQLFHNLRWWYKTSFSADWTIQRSFPTLTKIGNEFWRIVACHQLLRNFTLELGIFSRSNLSFLSH